MAILSPSRSVWRVGSTTFMRRSVSSSPRTAAEAALALAEEGGKTMGTGRADEGTITWEALDRAYAPKDEGLTFMAVLAAGTIIGGVLSFFVVREANDLKEQIKEVKERIKEQGTRISGVETRISGVEMRISEVETKVAVLDQKVDTLAKQLEKQFNW